MGIEWQFKDFEPRGQGCPGKIVLMQKDALPDDLEKIAYFKPDTDIQAQPESRIELAVHKIAKALGISSAKTEPYVYNEKNGILSYNFKTNNKVEYVPAGTLFPAKGTPKNRRTSELVDVLPIQDICKKHPVLIDGIIKMAYLDCLVSNFDRNSSNWEIEVDTDKNGELLRLAPLFDHGFCMQNNHGIDESLIYFDVPGRYGEYPTHFDVFQKLCKNYPEQTKELLEKTEKLSEDNILDDFTLPRFEKMKEIFEKSLQRSIENTASKGGITQTKTSDITSGLESKAAAIINTNIQ